jgi:hypothetical protein
MRARIKLWLTGKISNYKYKGQFSVSRVIIRDKPNNLVYLRFLVKKKINFPKHF